jgi:glycosyltransferase involved in cell wall biosynthesis
MEACDETVTLDWKGCSKATEVLRAPLLLGTAGGSALQLSIVVPTFNEAENVPLLVERVAAALADTRWEIIFVDDDSPDGTTTAARRIARIDPRVRCLRRIGRRGLAGACSEGILSSSAPVVAIMDADLQHDESLLLRMLSSIDQGAELVVGTRFSDGGTARGGLSCFRLGGSRLASDIARRVLGVAQRPDERVLHDPPRAVRGTRPEALDARIQGPARHRRVEPGAIADRRAAV